MKPAVTRELRVSWSIFAGVVAVCALFLAWWSDWGATAEQVAQARARYQAEQGQLVLAHEVREQSQYNRQLHDEIEDLKDRIGVRNVPPFKVPENDARPHEFWQPLRITVVQELGRLAGQFSIDGYDWDLGFEDIPPLPDPERVPDYLLYLQLATKAAYLSIHSPGRDLHDIDIEVLNDFRPVVEAPEGRPPLLREYRISLTVTGPLQDQLWLLHQLVAEEPTPEHQAMQRWLIGSPSEREEGVLHKVYRAYRRENPDPPRVDPEATLSPLVLRRIEVLGSNVTADEQITDLTVTYEVAGLQFLDPEARGTPPPGSAGAGSAGSNAYGAARRGGKATP